MMIIVDWRITDQAFCRVRVHIQHETNFCCAGIISILNELHDNAWTIHICICRCSESVAAVTQCLLPALSPTAGSYPHISPFHMTKVLFLPPLLPF